MSSTASGTPGAAEQGTPAAAPASSLQHSRSNSSRSGRIGVASKIAAFASGVAPVQRTDEVLSDEEQEQTVEELLHRLEAATRGPAAIEGRVVLPLKMVLQVVERFGALSQEAARLGKELEKAKDNSSQGLLMPSAWVKREHKYKQDLETFERKIVWQAERIEQLEAELVQQREGDNLRPLEERINELEGRLRATAEEKTQALSKFHELSIKHRQMIETSPHVSAVWREVLVQQSNGKDAAAVTRLTNFDLRHTNGAAADLVGADGSPSSHEPAATVADPAALRGGRDGSSSAGWTSQASQLMQLAGQAANASVNESRAAAAATSGAAAAPHADAAAVPAGSDTATGSGTATAADAGAARAGSVSAPSSQPPQSAEAQAQALIASIAAEQATPEAAVEALQQLNYDLTMQLGMYQQMVLRLKDAMEEADLAKAELEAGNASLEMQLEQLRAQAQQAGLHMPRSASMQARASSMTSKAGWAGWWRGRGAISNGRVSREGVPAAGALSDDEESVSSMVRGSLTAMSVRSSLDGALFATAALDGDGEVPELSPRTAPGEADADDDSALPATASAAAANAAAGLRGEAAPMDAAAALAAAAKAQSKLKRATAAAARAAEEREQLARDAKEAWRQVASMGEENRFLVSNLVEIKTELAEAQGTVMQFKRALLRAMDDKVCMETKVAELRNMLNIATAVNSSSVAGSGFGSEPSRTPHANSASHNDDALAWVDSKAGAVSEPPARVSGGYSSSPPGTPPSASGGGGVLPSDVPHTGSSLDGHALSDGGDGASSSEGEHNEQVQAMAPAAEARASDEQLVGEGVAAMQADIPAADGEPTDAAAGQGEHAPEQEQRQLQQKS